MAEVLNEKSKSEDTLGKKKEANQCIALGAGVGALGTGAAIITGAVCPLCVVVAPALIATGAFLRLSRD